MEEWPYFVDEVVSFSAILSEEELSLAVSLVDFALGSVGCFSFLA